MGDLKKRLPAIFYRTDTGNEPVRKWLKSQDEADRKTIGCDLKDVEYGWPVGMPLCGSLGDGLWEVRSDISSGRISRVIFFIWQGRMVLLHGFIKKTRKTPASDKMLALKRKKETETNG